MNPTPNNLDRIGEGDLKSLINTAREDRFIDFKEQPYAKDVLAKEFSKDVCAFANTSGGCIVLGVVESAGVASQVPGFELQDADKLFRQLQQVLSSNTRPCPFVRFRKIDVEGGRQVVIVGVPSSRNRPHMVTASWPGVFYKRTDGGTVEVMDVDDIRRAFSGSLSELEEVEHRHHAMMQSQVPPAGYFLIGVTIAPLPADEERLDFKRTTVLQAAREIHPVYYSAYDFRHTFDGVVAHRSTHGHLEHRISRSGKVSGVYGIQIYQRNRQGSIPASYVMKELALLLRSTFAFYQVVGISGSFLFRLSLKGCGGLHVGASDWSSGEPIEQDTLDFRSVAIDDLATSPYVYLADPMQRLWQAGGFSACQFYNRETGAFDETSFRKIYGDGM